MSTGEAVGIIPEDEPIQVPTELEGSDNEAFGLGEESDDEDDEPLPFKRIHSFTVKGLGLLHNYVPVTEDDTGKRCVVDGFPENGTMRFMGIHTAHDAKLFGTLGEPRCVVQIENPDGEDKVLTEKGLLVKLSKVKLAADETVLSGMIVKRGGKVKTWKKRLASLDGDGCLRYYADSKKKTLKGWIDIRRDCNDITYGYDNSEANWPPQAKPDKQLCLLTADRTYYFLCNSDADRTQWEAAFERVARQITRVDTQESVRTEPDVPAEIKSKTSEAGEEELDAGGDLYETEGPIRPLSSDPPPDVAVDRRVRRHTFRTALTNNRQTCKACSKTIGMRVKHRICTQCRKRYHVNCPPAANADCCPPAFCTPAAVKRVAPPISSNLAAAVEFTSTSGTVPGIVEDLIAIIKSRGMVEGIFRVPGNKFGMQNLLTQYFDNPKRRRLGVYTIGSIHDCSSALKLFLRNLDEPILTYDLYPSFVRAVMVKDIGQRELAMVHTLGQLPKQNYYTIRTLIVDLLHVVAENVDETKMKMSNLAAVFAPTIMQPPGIDDEESVALVMAQMKTVDVLLKLSLEAWNAAERIVLESGRVQSSSPIMGAGSTKSSKDSNTTLPDRNSIESDLGSDTVTTSTADVNDTADNFPSIEDLPERKRLSSRSQLKTGSDSNGNKGEIEELLEERQEEFNINDVSDVVEGIAEGAMLPGFEEFSLDAFDDGTVTIDTRPGRKRKVGDRLSGAKLGVVDESEKKVEGAE